ncbi:MAG: TIGR02996 domain-containing protein [Enhygromyxa sp.]
MTATPSERLDRALEAVESGDYELALEQLCEVWQSVRDRELAAAIELISPRAASTRPPLSARTKAELDKVWMRRARAGHRADLHLLLPILVEATNDAIHRRVDLLNRRAPDPRVSARLARLAAARPFVSAGSMRFWSAVHRLLRQHFDPRTAPLLERAAPPALREQPRSPEQRLAVLHHETLEHLRAVSNSARELDPEAAERCRQLVASLAARPLPVVDRLFAEVYEHPEDLDRRRILADYLNERGDPRGEFIALQLAGDELGRVGRRRIEELLRKHELAWLGPLAPVLRRGSLEFSNGFPSRASVIANAHDIAELAEDPRWSTIEQIDRLPDELAVHPNMRSVRQLSCSPRAALTIFSDSVVRPELARFEFVLGSHDADPLAGLRARSLEQLGLPGLRTLVVHGHDTHPQAWAWLWQSRWVGELARVELHSSACDLREWLPMLQRRGLTDLELLIHTWSLRFEFGHVEAGDWRRVRVSLRQRSRYGAEDWDPYDRDELRGLVMAPLWLDELEVDEGLARHPDLASAIATGVITVADHGRLAHHSRGHA